MAPRTAATPASAPAIFETELAAALPVDVPAGADEMELPAVEPLEVLVDMDTAGEVVGAVVTMLPADPEEALVALVVSVVSVVSVVECVELEVVSDRVEVVAAILPLGP